MELTHFFYKEPTWELTQAIPFKAVNLLVGKNAVGKSKVIAAIFNMANIILQQDMPFVSRISCSSTFSFKDEEEVIEYHFTYQRGIITEENLTINGQNLLNRNEKETLLEGMPINPPTDKLTLHVRRDIIQYPYFEKIITWAENVYGQRFNEIEADRGNKTNSFLSPIHKDDLFTMVKSLPSESIQRIIEQAQNLDYHLEAIKTFKPERFKIVLFKEKGIKEPLFISSLSKGMCRAISLLIQMEYLSAQGKPSLWLIDDLGEGLDYDRTVKLGKLLFDFCHERGIQLLASSNDTFLMDIVDLQYWNILERKGEKVMPVNTTNSPDLFEDFKFTGLSNFDFFSSDYISRHTDKNSTGYRHYTRPGNYSLSSGQTTE